MRSVNALGFIEMYGLVGCIEAADAMVKSANVSLVQHGEISAGLVTVVVEGDVAACQAAVNAGVAAGSRLGTVVAHMVIPRPTNDTANMIFNLIPQARDEYKKGFSSGGSDSGSGGNEPPTPTPPAPPPAPVKEAPAKVEAKPLVTPQKAVSTKIEPEKKEAGKSGSVVKDKTVPVPVPTATKTVLAEKMADTAKQLPKKPVQPESKALAKPKALVPEKKQVEASAPPVKQEAQIISSVKINEPAGVIAKATVVSVKEKTSAPAPKPKSGVASVLAQFVQSTEGAVFSEEELNKTVQYISTHEKGLAWKEISKHFPQHSKQLQQKLDGLVASGKLTKTGSRYGKPK